jgi:hypothetical protein
MREHKARLAWGLSVCIATDVMTLSTAMPRITSTTRVKEVRD